MRILLPRQAITLPLGWGARSMVVHGVLIRSLRAEKRKKYPGVNTGELLFFVFKKSKGCCKELLEGISRAGE